MKALKTICKIFAGDTRGIALLLVMTVVTVVSASILVGAGLIISNLDSIKARSDLSQAELNAEAAMENARGWVKQNVSVFSGCQVDDCFSAATGTCVSCGSGDALYVNGDISYRSAVKALVEPVPDTVGYATFAVDAFYRYRHAKKTDHVCLDYCAASGYECGDDGCGGVCGTCGPSETCGGGGVPGVCDSGNCSDMGLECGNGCIEGATCGGGIVIDAANNIVMSQSGCNGAGDDCDGSTDTVSAVWDEGDSANTAAENEEDGRVNEAILDPLANPRYAAAAYCANLQYGGYDWYLPSKNELDAIYATKVAGGLSGFMDAYWTSTDHNASNDSSWYQNMTDGSAGVQKKSSSAFIRCVRRY